MQESSTRLDLANNLQSALLGHASADATQAWCSFKEAVFSTAVHVLGHRQRRHRDWFDENDKIAQQLIDTLRSKHYARWSTKVA